MITVLGFRRVLLLAGLVGLNAAAGATIYMYLLPTIDAQDKELRTVKSKVGQLRTDIDSKQVELQQLEKQAQEFRGLETRGFFKNQSRRLAQDVFNAIQKKSGVSKAIASVNAGEIEDNADAQKAKHKILKSDINVEIEAIDDLDVYNYIYLVKNNFPGHVTLQSMNVKRDSDLSGTILQSVATGGNPALVKAKIQLIWRTMIPEEAVIESQGGSNAN